MMMTNVSNCARCGKDHHPLDFQKFKVLPRRSDYTHWALCPTTGEPILMTVYQDKPLTPMPGAPQP